MYGLAKGFLLEFGSRFRVKGKVFAVPRGPGLESTLDWDGGFCGGALPLPSPLLPHPLHSHFPLREESDDPTRILVHGSLLPPPVPWWMYNKRFEKQSKKINTNIQQKNTYLQSKGFQNGQTPKSQQKHWKRLYTNKRKHKKTSIPT